MNRKMSGRAGLISGVAFATCILTAVVMRARAAGVPDTDALTYTGYLESSEGTPLTGTRAISVKFWESQEAADPLCTGNAPNTDLQSGRFQVALPASCAEAVAASPDVWVEVEVDGAPLGRTKLGAVPYALEAGHATNADQAGSASAADGALDTRIGDLEAESPGQSAFRAISNGADVLSGQRMSTAFDAELFDLGSEFVPGTGTFTTKQGGYYEIGCNFFFYIASAGVFFMEAGVLINGKLADAGNITAAAINHQGVRAQGLFKLAANDQVQCGAYQSSGSIVTIRSTATFPNEPPSSFNAVRVKPL